MDFSSVYVIAASNNMSKVGISINPARRVSQLQTGNGSQLSLAYSLSAVKPVVEMIERSVHTKMRRYREQGEWFSVKPQTAIAFVGSEFLAIDDYYRKFGRLPKTQDEIPDRLDLDGNHGLFFVVERHI